MSKKKLSKLENLCTKCAGGGQARELIGTNWTWTTCSKCNGTGKK